MSKGLNVLQSNSVEWYTPSRYIEAAREVLGRIDVDPASTAQANETVKADAFYTKEDEGLNFRWKGRVWLNPPYGRLCGEFVRKAIVEYEYGDMDEAILLLNANSCETKWFRPLWNYVLCFADHRINFVSSDGISKSAPTHGSVFVYLGKNISKFVQVFSEFGIVVQRHKECTWDKGVL